MERQVFQKQKLEKRAYHRAKKEYNEKLNAYMTALGKPSPFAPSPIWHGRSQRKRKSNMLHHSRMLRRKHAK